MNTTANPFDFAIKLCNILQIDAKKTRTVTISVRPDDIVLVNVGQVLQQEEGEKILELIKEYKLVKTDTTDEIKVI